MSSNEVSWVAPGNCRHSGMFKLEYVITPADTERPLGVGNPCYFLLRLACAALHLLGGSLGYLASDLFGFDERTCRTVAIVSWLT